MTNFAKKMWTFSSNWFITASHYLLCLDTGWPNRHERDYMKGDQC